MKKLVCAWNDYWFAPTSVFNLAVCRVFFFGLLFSWYGSYDEPDWYTLRHGGIWYPVGIFSAGVPVFEPELLSWVRWSMGIFYLLAALGLFTRWSTAGAFITTLYVFALRQNFGKYTGGGVDIALFVIGGFALSRAGDYLSLDRLLQILRRRWAELRTRRRDGTALKELAANIGRAWLSEPEPSGHYRWPLRFGWMMFFMLYFTAGLSKLSGSGLEWALSDNLRNLLIRHHYSHAPPTALGLWIAEREWAYKAIGLSSLFAEVFCPLGMLHWRARLLFVIALASMQYGIYLTMGVTFRFVKLLVLVFIPWDLLFQFTRGRWLSLSRTTSTNARSSLRSRVSDRLPRGRAPGP